MLRAQECEYSTGPAKKAAQPAAASAEQGQVCRLALSRLHDLAACMVCSGDTLPKDVPCVSRLSSAGSACRPARLQRLRTRAVSFTVLSFVVNDVQRCALMRAVRSSRACFTTSCCSLKQVLTMARWMQTCSHGMRSICTTYIGLPACHECGDVPDRTDPLERASGCCVSKRTPPGSGWRGGGPVGCLHGRHQCGGA